MSKSFDTEEQKDLSAEDQFTQQMLSRFSGAWHGDECAEDIIAAINEGKGIKDPLSM